MPKFRTVLDRLRSKVEREKASSDAAIAASAQATSDKESVVAEKKVFATILESEGPVAVPEEDGNFTAYFPDRTNPDGFYSQPLKGPEEEVEDPSEPETTDPANPDPGAGGPDPGAGGPVTPTPQPGDPNPPVGPGNGPGAPSGDPVAPPTGDAPVVLS